MSNGLKTMQILDLRRCYTARAASYGKTNGFKEAILWYAENVPFSAM